MRYVFALHAWWVWHLRRPVVITAAMVGNVALVGGLLKELVRSRQWRVWLGPLMVESGICYIAIFQTLERLHGPRIVPDWNVTAYRVFYACAALVMNWSLRKDLSETRAIAERYVFAVGLFCLEWLLAGTGHGAAANWAEQTYYYAAIYADFYFIWKLYTKGADISAEVEMTMHEEKKLTAEKHQDQHQHQHQDHKPVKDEPEPKPKGGGAHADDDDPEPPVGGDTGQGTGNPVGSHGNG